MIDKDKIGVAVVGLGVGEQHAMAYLATGCCQLRWLCDIDVSKAQEVATRLGTGDAVANFEQVLEDEEVDAISIASYDDVHFQQVLAALAAGKHVFVEKPLCRTLEELKSVKGAWSAHSGNLKLSSNLILRAAPLYQWLKQKLEGGEFGDLFAFDGEYLYGRIHKITDGWRRDVDDYSVMEGGGVHLIDLMVWLTGERPLSVHALGNRICTQGSRFRYNDYVAATLPFSSGLIGRISANFGCMHRHQHVLRLFGTKATFLYDDAGPRLHLTRDAAATGSQVTLPALPATKGELIASFVSAILNRADMDHHTQEIFDVISICAACDTSLESGSSVEVHYV